MILQRTEHDGWLSNSYLVIDEPGGSAVLIDGNDTVAPLLERLEAEQATLTYILATHDHHDHLAGLDSVRMRTGATLVASAETAARATGSGLTPDREIADRELLSVGGLEIEAIATPGHAAGHLAFLINGRDCFTGDSLFKGTVAGTLAPGATGFADLKGSIMDRLMRLPGETRLHPGHREPTTVAAEWEDNPFIRIWRGLDPEGEDSCTVFGERPATLVLWAPDYDGTNKAWVRFDDDGADGIVGGSQVTR